MLFNLFKKTDYAALLSKGAKVVDVRSEQEFAGGCIPGSMNIPVNKIGSKIDALKKLNVPVICVCASGMRSGVAKSQLKASGLDAYNAGAWTKLIPFF
jgi:phage shock protein E